MIKKENKELSKCKLLIPSLNDMEFMGCFEIKDDILTFWIDFNKDDSHLDCLDSLLRNDDGFTVKILDANMQGYSCFDCYSKNVPDILRFDFGLIQFFCNRWIESYHIDSENIPFAKRAYLDFPFIEYWFSGVDNAIFPVRNEYEIKCCNVPGGFIDRFKCRNTNQRHCYFEVKFDEEKTLNEIIKVEDTIWLFLRFATNIPIPRAKIVIPFPSNVTLPNDVVVYTYEMLCTYHFSFRHHPMIEDYANSSAYADMPIKLKAIVNKTDIFEKWDTFLTKHYHAFKMWSKEMSRTSLLDERISHYVQIIDSLTADKLDGYLKQRIQQCLEDYKNDLPFEIDKNTSENLKSIRVAFSHLYEEKFVLISEVTSRKYLQYERIMQKLIQIMIKDRLGMLTDE